MGNIYIGVNGTPKRVKALWVGVNGVPKKIKNAWVGVNGVPKIVYTALEASYITSVNHEGYVTWASASGATSYTVQKLENDSWYGGLNTSNLYYNFENFSPSTTMLRVISYDDSGHLETSPNYPVNWVKLTFNANGGSSSTSYYDRISGEQIGTLPTATRSSYNFDYWAQGSTSGSRVYTTTTFTSDTILYAHWTLHASYITSVDHEGYVTWAAISVATSYTIQKLENGTWYNTDTSNPYYTFNNFSPSTTTLRVIAYDSSGNYSASPLYSVGWVKITFNGNGGSSSTSYYDRISGEQIGTLPTATRSSYSFDYWTQGSASGSRVYTTTTFTEDTILYAHWTLDASYITSVDHEGYITWASVPAAAFYNAQKLENGTWYNGTDTSSLYYDFANFSTSTTAVRVVAYDNSGNYAISPQYLVNWVKITFNANGGSSSTSYYNRISGEQIGTLPTATRSNYSFDYWTNGSTSGSRVYTTTTFTADTILYAHWTATTVYYTITLDATTNGGTGGGTYSRESGTTFYLSNYSASKSSTTSQGYRYTYSFKGWYTASDGGTKTTSITVTGDKTYYAQFSSSSSLILQAPTGVRVSGKTVSWSAATGAVKYKVFKNGNAAGTAPGNTYSGSYTTSTSYTFGSTANMYEVWVVAYDDYGNSRSSSSVYP